MFIHLLFLLGVSCGSESTTSLPTTKTSAENDSGNSNDDQNPDETVENPEDNPEEDPQDQTSESSSEPSQPEVSQPSDDTSTTGFQLYDFTLSDENPYSSSYENDITPSDYLGQVTGWYFIKAT